VSLDHAAWGGVKRYLAFGACGRHHGVVASQDDVVLTPRQFNPDDFASAYRSGRMRITDMVASFNPEQQAAIVPTCPDWTVTQLCAHLAGVASALVHRNNPAGDLQAWIDGHIYERADRSATELMAEWNEVGEQFEAIIVKRPQSFAGLLYDVIAHEHDMALAAGVIGERTGLGVEASLALALPLLEHDLAAHGLGAVAVDLDDGRWQAGEGTPGLIVTLPSHFAAIRLLGSRRSRSQLLAAPWSGPDVDRIGDYLVALDHLGFPADDVDE
jgi:uncharacterized protein (TIGR03083 family)